MLHLKCCIYNSLLALKRQFVALVTLLFKSLIRENIKKPYFLAGGLKPDNVEDAVKRLHPYAVDVSSGIETGGVKDLDKIAAFVAAVRKEEET